MRLVSHGFQIINWQPLIIILVKIGVTSLDKNEGYDRNVRMKHPIFTQFSLKQHSFHLRILCLTARTRLKYKSGFLGLGLQQWILFLIGLESSSVQLVVETYFGPDLSFLKPIHVAFKRALKDLSTIIVPMDFPELLDDPEGKFLRDSRPKRLQIQLYHSDFPLLQALCPQQSNIDMTAIVEPKLQSEGISCLAGHVLIGETGSSPAILSCYLLIAQFSLADLLDEIVPLRVVMIEDFMELVVFLDDLQDEDGIGFQGRVGVDEEVLDDQIEVAFPVGLQDRWVVCLIAVVLLQTLGVLLDLGERPFMEGLRP